MAIAARTGQRGMTLLEIMMVLSILSVAMLAAFSTLSQSQDVVAQASTSAELGLQTRFAFADLEVDFKDARVLTPIDGTHAVLDLQVPIGFDQDGDAVDDFTGVNYVGANYDVDFNGVVWGAESTGGWSIRYTLDSTSTLDESAVTSDGWDINGDGDTSDVFQLSNLIRTVLDETGAEESTYISAHNLVTVFGNPDGDVSGEGESFYDAHGGGSTQTGAPIFLVCDDAGVEDLFDGTNVKVVLQFAKKVEGEESEFVYLRTEYQFQLRNKKI